MAWAVNRPADSDKLRVSAGLIRANWAALQAALSSTTLAAGSAYIPASAPIWFYTATAPTGWTLSAVTGDSLLAVQGGTSAYAAAGGTQVGTWLGPPHMLSIAEMPAHTHTVASSNSATGFGLSATTNPISNSVTSSTGGNATHHHDYTVSNTRPMANVGIICYKNYP